MKHILIFCLFLSLLCTTAFAEEERIFQSQYDALQLHELERDARRYGAEESFEITKELSFTDGFNRLVKRVKKEGYEIFCQGLKCVSAVLMIAVLCALILSVYRSSASQSIPNYVFVVGALAITGACVSTINSMISIGKSALANVDAFSKALLPALMATSVALGKPASASVLHTITVWFADVLITVINRVFFPLVYAYIAAVTGDAAVGNGSLTKVASFLQWLVSGGLKLFLMVFVTYLTVSGALAGTTDIISIKTAKFALSGSVPIVGSVIADAAGTVIAGAAVIKNAIGVFGLLSVCSICLTPFLTLFVNFFLFRAAAAAAAPMLENRLAKLVDQLGTGFGIVLGMSASGALLMFLSILSSLYITGAA